MLHYPIILIKKSEASIYQFKKGELGLISKGGENFYKNGDIYDAAGNMLMITRVKSIKKAPFLKSLKFFQPMKIADIETTFVSAVDLSEFKDRINKHVSKFSNYWKKKDAIEQLQESINKMKSHEEIINYLN